MPCVERDLEGGGLSRWRPSLGLACSSGHGSVFQVLCDVFFLQQRACLVSSGSSDLHLPRVGAEWGWERGRLGGGARGDIAHLKSCITLPSIFTNINVDDAISIDGQNTVLGSCASCSMLFARPLKIHAGACQAERG